jgi:hypothetical protein
MEMILNCLDELEDDALSDGGTYEITPEQEGMHFVDTIV